MKCVALFLLPSLAWFSTGLAPVRADDEVPATRLHRICPYDKLPKDQSAHRSEVDAGDLIQISTSLTGPANQALRHRLKVEIEGDAVEKMVVAYVPLEFPLDPIDPPGHHDNSFHGDLSCFLKAVKKGKATVKVTQVYDDVRGMQAAKIIIISVRGELPEEQATPTVRVERVYPYDKLRNGAETHEVGARPDDLIQLHVPSTIIAKEKLRGIKVEISGEAVKKLVVAVPVESTRQDDPESPLDDQFTKDICCLLKAVKPGKATVKITPIDKDGKEKATGTVVVTVREKLQPKK